MTSSVNKLEAMKTNHSPLANDGDGVSLTLLGMRCFPWGTCLGSPSIQGWIGTLTNQHGFESEEPNLWI
ncbi:hypothetical protein CEXT_729411 [Caerostris extrusa]|uniref:Uncharacterized protein n=1 Tax=Caerostris extrusa TaxID=172846 RepID=A0AAV4M575_CAEEX|nr:hypothetical protein CEXT_729411 [Caerostris extrusa]